MEQKSVVEQWDMIKIMEAVLALPNNLDSLALRETRKHWVTDGTMIWSTEPIFHEKQFLIDSCNHQPFASTTNPLEYDNEQGRRLQVADVTITYRQAIDLTDDVGEIFFDETSARFKDSRPHILVKGLNAFFARHARRQLRHPNVPVPTTLWPPADANAQTLDDNPFVCVGANKSFGTGAGKSLENQNKTVCAKDGFTLSVRPGVEAMFINLGKATSGFFEPNITVQDFINNAWDARSLSEILGCLKGLKVKITYKTRDTTAVTFPSSRSRIRFIMEVTDFCEVETRISRTPLWPRAKNVAHWYHPNSPYNRDNQYPTQTIHLVNDWDFAVTLATMRGSTQSAQNGTQPSVCRFCRGSLSLVVSLQLRRRR